MSWLVDVLRCTKAVLVLDRLSIKSSRGGEIYLRGAYDVSRTSGGGGINPEEDNPGRFTFCTLSVIVGVGLTNVSPDKSLMGFALLEVRGNGSGSVGFTALFLPVSDD